MTELPERLLSSWSSVSLSDIADINPTLDKSRIPDKLEISFVPMRAVEERTGRIDLSASRCFAEVKKGYTAFQEGDVLFAKITPCMENGKMAVVPALKNGHGFGSTEFHVLRPFQGMDARYLYHFVSSQKFRYDAERKMIGAVGQRRVPAAYIGKHQIPVPPYREQRRIVAKIEELFSELDKGIEALTTAREQLKAYHQSVLKQTFLGSESRASNKLPARWTWIRLDALTEIITKGASPKWQGIDYVDDATQTLFVTSENVRENYVDLSKQKYVEDKFNDGQKRSILRRGDLLFNIVGASIGRSAVFKDTRKANINQAVAVIRILDIDVAEYVSLFLNSSLGQSRYMNKRVEVARANLSLKDVSEISIPMPPAREVPKLLRRLSNVLDNSDRLFEDIERQLMRVDTLRQSILKKAFSGQLVPQDPTDEPASVLLERIRAGRGNGLEPRRKRTRTTASRKVRTGIL